MQRRPPRQAALFEDPAQERGREESAALYALIVKLRGAGMTVHRAGRLHIVDGKQLTRAQLELMVSRLGPPARP